jgi:hypothetical protein
MILTYITLVLCLIWIAIILIGHDGYSIKGPLKWWSCGIGISIFGLQASSAQICFGFPEIFTIILFIVMTIMLVTVAIKTPKKPLHERLGE